MKQSKRVLSFLLAFMMLATTLVFSTNAKAPLPTDALNAIYDQTSKIILSTDQYATLALDMVDEMLAESAIYLDIGELVGEAGIPLPLSGTVDLRSLDAAFSSLATLQGTLLQTVYNLVPILGHGGLNLEYVQRADCRRSSAAHGTNADTYVLRQIFKIFSDPDRSGSEWSNPKLLGKLVSAALTGGTELNNALGSVVGPLLPTLLGGELDVVKMVKEMVWKMGSEEEMPTPAPTLDAMIQGLLPTLLGETKLTVGESEIDLGAIIGSVNIETDSMYQLVDKILQPAYTEVIAPMMDTMLREMLADAATSSGFGSYVNLNFVVPTWAELGIGSNDTIFSKLNNILGLFITRVITYPGLTWQNGTNDKLVPNIIAVGKILIKDFGNDIFPGVVFKPASEIDAMSEMTFVAYLARTIVNQVMDYVYVPEKIGAEVIDTLTEVLNVVLIEQAGDTVPERYNALTTAYYNTPTNLNNLATTLEILADYLVKLLYFEVDTNVLTGIDRSGIASPKATATAAGVNTLRYADTFDQVIGKLANWVVGNYGGVINPTLIATPATTPTNAWKTFTNIFFGLIDSSWLGGTGNYGRGTGQRGLKELIIDDILGQLLGSADTANPNQIRISKALEIFSKNTTGTLHNTVAKVLIKLILDVLDLVLGGASGNVSTAAMRDPTNGYKTLEDILQKKQFLGDLVTNLLARLGEAGDRLIPTALPLISETKMAAYRAPAIALPRMIPYQSSYTFTVENDSAGLPGMNYNPEQQKKAESKYVYRLQSAKVNYSKAYSGNMSIYKDVTGLNIVDAATNQSLSTNPVTLTAGQKADLKLNLPPEVSNGLVTVALTYNVSVQGGATISTLTTHLYTFVAQYDINHPDTNLMRKETIGGQDVWTVNDDTTRKPTVVEGMRYFDMVMGGGTETKAEQGYSNAITYPAYRFFNQNTTMGQLVDALSVTVARPADMGKMDANGNQTAPPVNTLDSSVGIDPYYYYNGALPDGDYQTAYADDLLGSGGFISQELKQYITIIDPTSEEARVATKNDGASATLKPFELLDPALKDTPVIDLLQDGYYYIHIYLAGDGTKAGKTGNFGPTMAGDDAEGFNCIINFVVENDYGLTSLVNKAIASDEQSEQYTNATVFNTYMDNLSKAAWLVFKPKSQSLATDAAQSFQTQLSNNIEELKACVSTTGATDQLKTLLQKVYGLKDNAKIVDGELVYLDYWDPSYTYFAKSDFIPTGFEKALSAISMAEELIARNEEGEDPPSQMEIKYCEALLKETCDSRVELPYTSMNDQYNNWQLLPTAAYQHAMEYQMNWLLSNQLLGNSGVTFAQLKAAFDAAGGYTATGDYTTTVSDGAGGYIALEGDPVRALMRAYDNIQKIYSDYIPLGAGEDWTKEYQMGQSDPKSPEFASDRGPLEVTAFDMPELKRIPQSRLTRARDELVYAYKRIIGAVADEEPTGLIWTALDTIYDKITKEKIASEGDKTLQQLFTQYTGAFVPAYETNYTNLFGQATTLLTTVKGNETQEAEYVQADIDGLAAKLTKASKLMVAVVPNPGAYVYNASGVASGIKADLAAYNAVAATAIAAGKSVKEFLNTGEYVLQDTLGAAGNKFYDGYIYGLDISKPTLLGVSGKPVPYKVINGTAAAPVANTAGKYLTGATLVVNDADGTEIFRLKSVYFGDTNGNGTILEPSEINDLGMVLSGQKWNVGTGTQTAGEYSPVTLAMDVYTRSTLTADDQTAFKTLGTRFVDQASYVLAPNVSIVKVGKPTPPVG